MPEFTSKSRNYAFIDSQNLNLAIQEQGWKLNWQRFRSYLRDKFDVERAYLFVGYLAQNEELYKSLEAAGYVLIYKPIMEHKDGTVKGNVDAEMVLQAMIDFNHYHKAVIVTGDGDFYSLVQYLYEHGKLAAVLAPNQHKYSALLAQSAKEKIQFLNKLRRQLAYTHKRKTPAEAPSATESAG